MEIQVGDTVMLKSGGPKMTVKTVLDGVVTVEWYDAETGYQTKDDLELGELVKVD